MPRNGLGTYTLPAGQPVVTGTVIDSSVFNTFTSDVASALTGSLTANGEKTASGNQPMGGFKHTGVGDSTARSSYPSTAQIQDRSLATLSGVAGTDTITATLTPSLPAYVAGQLFTFQPAGNNTGATTLNINGLGAKDIRKGSTHLALEAGDLVSGNSHVVVYSGTIFKLLNPAVPDSRYALASGPTFTGPVSIANTDPYVLFRDTDAGVDVKNWIIEADGGLWRRALYNDALGASLTFESVTRSGIASAAIAYTVSSFTVNGGTVWHSGNDGAGSGLDADLLDGQDSNFYQNANNLALGTVPAGRMPAHTGDVTSSAGSVALTVANNAVTYAKMQDVSATNRFLGRITAGAGDPEELTGTQAKTILAIAASDVSGLATVATSGSATDLTTGTLPAGRMPAHTGDVTSSAGSVALTVANNAVTYAKMQDVSATSRVLGRITAGAGDPEELTGANLSTIIGLATVATSASATDLTTGTLNAARLPSGFNSTTMNNMFALNSANTPSAISGSVNDYNPPITGSNVLRVSATSASFNITGLAAGSAGQFLLVINVGSNAINLTNEDASSSAANRWATQGAATKTLNAGCLALAWYDGTSSRWRVGLLV